MFKKGGIGFKFFDAVDGNNMTTREKQLTDAYFEKGKLTDKQRGCFLSHLLLYDKIIKEKHDNTLILEDDATSDDLCYLKNLDKFLIDGYDILFLGHCAEPKGMVVKELYTIHRSVWPRCLHAYVVSRTGARKLAAFFKRKKWNLPIDELIPRAQLKSYSLFPTLIRQVGWQEKTI